MTTEADIGGGEIAGAYTLSIGDSPPVGPPQYAAILNWQGGTLSNSGLLIPNSNPFVIIGTSSTANISGVAVKTLDGRFLTNNGTVNWNGGGNILLKDSAQFLDYGAMNVNLAVNATVDGNGEANTKFQVKPGGTLNLDPVQGQNGNLHVAAPFRNDGTVNISNTGWLLEEAWSEDTGTFIIQPGSELGLRLTDHYLTGATIGGAGEVYFDPASKIHLSGTVTVGNVDDAAVVVDDSNGSTLLVGGTYIWRGGKWAGSGTTQIGTLANRAFLNLADNGTTAYDLERQLVNYGTVTWTKAADINVSNGGSINNKAAALFDIQVGQTIKNSGGAGNFTNAGVLRKSAGGVANINVPYQPVTGSRTEGKVNTLRFTGPKVSLLGDVEVDVSATVAFDGGVELDGGSVTNNGILTAIGDVLQNGGFVADAGTITTSGDWLYNAGTFALSAGTLTANNLNVAFGVTFSGYGSVYANVVNAGEIDAVDNYDSPPLPLYVYGTYTQTAGTQTQPSVTNVNSGNTLQVSGLVDVQGGTVNVDGNGSTLIAKYGFNEEAGLVDLNVGTINVTGIYGETGGLTTLEAGTLIADNPGYGVQVTGGGVLSGYGAIFAGVIDGSEIDVQGGTLAVTGAYVQTGVTNVYGVTLSVTGVLDEVTGAMNMAGGALHVNGGYIIESSALLDGSGQLIADVTNNGTISCGTSTTFGGFNCVYDPMYGIQGNYSQSATGVLNMKIGGVNSYDTMSATGLASLGGTFNLSLINGFVPSSGDVYYLFQGRSTGGFAVCNLPQVSNGTLMTMYNWGGMVFYVYDQPNGYY